MAGLLLLWHCLCDCDQDVHGQKSDAVLVVSCEVLEKRDHLVDDDGWRHALDELCEVVGGLSPHHRGIVMYELAVVLSELLLRWRRGSCVRGAVKTGGGDLRGEPVGLGQAQDKRDKVLLDLLLRELLADFVQGLDSLVGLARAGYGHGKYARTFSLTSGSSIAAKFSSGERSTCPYSGPPTYSTNLPNSSLKAVSTSSSSSTDSAGNG